MLPVRPLLALILSSALALCACDRTCPPAPGGGAGSAPAAKPAGGEVGAPASGALARVNGVALTAADVKVLAGRGHGKAAPNKERERRVLENIVNQEMVAQAALKLGLDREAPLRDKLHLLQARADAERRRALYEAYLEREVTNKVRITDEEARAYWDKNKSAVRTAVHILQLRRRSEADINEAAKELAAGKDFVELAKLRPGVEGHGASGHKFWDMGFMHWAQIPAIWRGALLGLEVGKTTDVIKGPGGRSWILKVAGRQEDEAGAFDAYRKVVVDALRSEKRMARHEQVIGALKAAAKVEMTRAPAAR